MDICPICRGDMDSENDSLWGYCGSCGELPDRDAPTPDEREELAQQERRLRAKVKRRTLTRLDRSRITACLYLDEVTATDFVSGDIELEIEIPSDALLIAGQIKSLLKTLGSGPEERAVGFGFGRKAPGGWSEVTPVLIGSHQFCDEDTGHCWNVRRYGFLITSTLYRNSRDLRKSLWSALLTSYLVPPCEEDQGTMPLIDY